DVIFNPHNPLNPDSKPGIEGEIYIETYRGEDARHRVSTCRHPICSESLTSSDVLHHTGS
ncbi:MAG: hypothetical protein ACK49F_04940, partial [Bacteroidota bacterium]